MQEKYQTKTKIYLNFSKRIRYNRIERRGIKVYSGGSNRFAPGFQARDGRSITENKLRRTDGAACGSHPHLHSYPNSHLHWRLFRSTSTRQLPCQTLQVSCNRQTSAIDNNRSEVKVRLLISSSRQLSVIAVNRIERNTMSVSKKAILQNEPKCSKKYRNSLLQNKLQTMRAGFFWPGLPSCSF